MNWTGLSARTALLVIAFIASIIVGMLVVSGITGGSFSIFGYRIQYHPQSEIVGAGWMEVKEDIEIFDITCDWRWKVVHRGYRDEGTYFYAIHVRPGNLWSHGLPGVAQRVENERPNKVTYYDVHSNPVPSLVDLDIRLEMRC